MEDLRWILLLSGVALVVGIYLVGRRRGERDQSLLDAAHDIEVPGAGKRRAQAPEEPEELDGIAEELEQLTDLLADPTTRARRIQERAPTAGPEAVADTPDKIVAIHVVAARGTQFIGTDLVRVFEARGYAFGEHNIFHSIHEGRTVFSVVNMVKPGWFDLDDMDAFETPGISLFLRLPGPLAANVAFDILVAEADALAQILGGNLEDASHSTLTPQTVQHLREEVQAFARQSAAPARRDG